MMLQTKSAKESYDVPQIEARDAVSPGTLPVTMNLQAEEAAARTGVSRPVFNRFAARRTLLVLFAAGKCCGICLTLKRPKFQ